MPSLNLAVNTSRMPFTTKFSQISRAPEHLYYALLFSTNPAYSKREDVWITWLEMGFNLAIRDAPPGAAPSDRIVRTVHHTPRRIEMSLEGGRRTEVAKLEGLLKTIEGLRKGISAKEPSARAKTLMANKEVNAALVAPVMAALKGAKLRPSEIELFESTIGQALYTLTDPDITSVEVGAKIAIPA